MASYKTNTKYGMLKEGLLVYATNPIKVGSKTIYCSTSATAIYFKYGYKQIIRSEVPDHEEGEVVQEVYTEDDAHIYISYEIIKEE